MNQEPEREVTESNSYEHNKWRCPNCIMYVFTNLGEIIILIAAVAFANLSPINIYMWTTIFFAIFIVLRFFAQINIRIVRE